MAWYGKLDFGPAQFIYVIQEETIALAVKLCYKRYQRKHKDQFRREGRGLQCFACVVWTAGTRMYTTMVVLGQIKRSSDELFFERLEHIPVLSFWCVDYCGRKEEDHGQFVGQWEKIRATHKGRGVQRGSGRGLKRIAKWWKANKQALWYVVFSIGLYHDANSIEGFGSKRLLP